MKALKYYGKQDIRVEEVPEPECEQGKIKIKPEWCGICGTDLHEYLGGPNFIPTKPHPLTNEYLPVILGHEFSGIVVEVGPEPQGKAAKVVGDSGGVARKERIKVGDRVVVEPIIYDGSCKPCLRGMRNCCDRFGIVGLSGGGGGLAEYVTVDENIVHVLPDNIPTDIAALIEPLAVAWHAISVATSVPPQTALILGAGPIGLAILLCLQAHGVQEIIVSEVSQIRKAYAKDLGASRVLDPRTDDVVSISREFCDGEGPDVVFDCAGLQQTLDLALAAVRTGGTVANIAIWENGVEFRPTEWLLKEKRYVGSLMYAKGNFEKVINAISEGKLTPGKMITAKIRLEDVVEKGFKALIEEKDKHIKIIVQP
ncbi:hypothetical protein RUND412_004376 [Rhizina undulata]